MRRVRRRPGHPTPARRAPATLLPLPPPLQEATAGAVSLAAPAAEVETYVQLWSLRPWLDEGAADAVIGAALAQQRADERAGGGART